MLVLNYWEHFNGFLELFRSWPVATNKSLCLTYGKPEVSYNSLVDMYLGKRTGSLMKEFCNFYSLVMTVSKKIIVEIASYSNIGLTHCLQIWKIVCGLGPHF